MNKTENRKYHKSKCCKSTMVIQRKDRIFLPSYTKVAGGRDETTGPGGVLESLALGNRLGLVRLTGEDHSDPLQFTFKLPVPRIVQWSTAACISEDRGRYFSLQSNSFFSEVPSVLSQGVHISSVFQRDFYFPPNLV